MGLLDRFRKEERLHIDSESRKAEWIPKDRKPRREEIVELTREEQMEPKRVHPWKTVRGKQVIKKVHGGVKRIDKAVVDFNRRNPISGGPSFGYNTHRNVDPFGSTFDMGMQPMSQPRQHKKKKTSSKTKYHVVGGKAYPIAGTSKKSRKKRRKKASSKRKSSNDWDVFGAFGRM